MADAGLSRGVNLQGDGGSEPAVPVWCRAWGQLSRQVAGRVCGRGTQTLQGLQMLGHQCLLHSNEGTWAMWKRQETSLVWV